MQALRYAVETWSFAKLGYTIILLTVVWLFLAELCRLWFDQRVFLGTFEFYEKGEAKPAQARTFALLTLHQQKRLRDTLLAEQARRAKEGTTWSPYGGQLIDLPQSGIADLDLSVQGLNIGAILKRLRDWINPPNHIAATIEKGEQVRAAASWPRGPSRESGGKVDGRFFQTGEKPNESAAAFAFACHLAWIQTANTDAKAADVPVEEFCDWAEALLAYRSLYELSRSLEGLSEANIKTVKNLHVFVSKRIDHGAKYAEFRQLRADLFALLPAEQRTTDLAAQAQLDSAAYAISLDPEKRKLSAEDAKQVIFAEARPAIPVQGNKLAQPVPKTWADRLMPNAERLSAAARATGLIKGVDAEGNETPRCSAFLVGHGLLATVDFALLPINAGAAFPIAVAPGTFNFTFAEEAGTPGPSLAVEQILFASHPEHLALLRVSGHDPKAHPPLRIMTGPTQSLLNRDVVLVGYPFGGGRVSPEFERALLGGRPGLKRVMPGRSVNLEPIGGSWAANLHCDFSSGPGAAGGPVLDLDTGEVIALHHSGSWNKDRGNVSIATQLVDLPINPALPEELRRALNPTVSVRVVLPEGFTLRQALEIVARTGDANAQFATPSAPELNQVVRGGALEAPTTGALMEIVLQRLVDGKKPVRAGIKYKEALRSYEITIER